MAAFGRAGYGKEATEAILDVAGEYDFANENSREPIESLKSAIYDVLRSPDGVSRDQWVPILLDRLKKDPKQWSDLASIVLSYVGSQDPEIQIRLLSVATDSNYSVKLRGSAISGLVSCDPKLKQSSTVNLLRAALTGSEVKLIEGAMHSLYFAHLDVLPEQFDLFFHPNEEVKAIARRWYSGCPEVNGKLLLKKLLVVLDDPQRASDHRDVIRAIAAKAEILKNSGPFGPKREMPDKERVIKLLRDILVDGNKDLLADTIVALGKLTAESGSLVIEKVDFRVTPKRRDELAAAAKVANDRSGSGMGSAGSGGGGGGFF